MVLSVVGTAADTDVIAAGLIGVDIDVVVSVVFRSCGVVTVVAAGIVGTAGSVTFSVVTRQSEVTTAGGREVVCATRVGANVGNSGGAAAVEGVSSVEVVLRIRSVVGTDTNGTVISGLACCVVVAMVRGTSGVMEFVVFAGEDTVTLSSEGELRRGEVVEDAVLGEAGRVGVVVVRGTFSTVTGFVLVSVYAVVAALDTVVLSVLTVESDTSPEVAATGVTDVECDVASVVGCKAAGAWVVMAVGPSVGLVVSVVCIVEAVAVKSGRRKSVGLGEEVSQNRAVMAKGTVLVLVVLKGLMGELSVLLLHSSPTVAAAGWVSVTLIVDRGSTTSGLMGGGAVNGVGGAAVPGGAGTAG